MKVRGRDNDRVTKGQKRGNQGTMLEEREGKVREKERERRNPTIGVRRVRESREEGGERGWHESG